MDTSPFEQTTTPNVDRAQRLLSLREHPGFLDLIRLSQELVQTAVDNCSNYPGWDAQQIVVLKVRQQTAMEHHKLLFSKLQQVIDIGLQEGRDLIAARVLESKTPQQIVEESDTLRAKMLESFGDMDVRIAGSH